MRDATRGLKNEQSSRDGDQRHTNTNGDRNRRSTGVPPWLTKGYETMRRISSSLFSDSSSPATGQEENIQERLQRILDNNPPQQPDQQTRREDPQASSSGTTSAWWRNRLSDLASTITRGIGNSGEVEDIPVSPNDQPLGFHSRDTSGASDMSQNTFTSRHRKYLSGESGNLSGSSHSRDNSSNVVHSRDTSTGSTSSVISAELVSEPSVSYDRARGLIISPHMPTDSFEIGEYQGSQEIRERVAQKERLSIEYGREQETFVNNNNALEGLIDRETAKQRGGLTLQQIDTARDATVWHMEAVQWSLDTAAKFKNLQRHLELFRRGNNQILEFTRQMQRVGQEERSSIPVIRISEVQEIQQDIDHWERYEKLINTFSSHRLEIGGLVDGLDEGELQRIIGKTYQQFEAKGNESERIAREAMRAMTFENGEQQALDVLERSCQELSKIKNGLVGAQLTEEVDSLKKEINETWEKLDAANREKIEKFDLNDTNERMQRAIEAVKDALQQNNEEQIEETFKSIRANIEEISQTSKRLQIVRAESLSNRIFEVWKNLDEETQNQSKLTYKNLRGLSRRAEQAIDIIEPTVSLTSETQTTRKQPRRYKNPLDSFLLEARREKQLKEAEIELKHTIKKMSGVLDILQKLVKTE